MSIADHEIDEPDPLHCDDHGQAHPCKDCREEAYLEWFESDRKGELDVLGNRAVRR